MFVQLELFPQLELFYFTFAIVVSLAQGNEVCSDREL